MVAARRTRWSWLLTVVLGLAALLRPAVADACTTFLLDQGGAAIGKSYDWDIGYGLVVVNKRGVAKKALALNQGDHALTWTSQYGSLTFNQYGCELPNGGMNEAGLVIEIMWLEGTEYPPVDERPTVSELQWVQQALDRFATVAELVAAAPGLRVSPVYAKVHYLACDATKACAALEYVGGELVVTTGSVLVVKTLTNDTYSDSAAFLAKHVGFGGQDPIPTGTDSLSRFVRASALALAPQTEPVPSSAFAILDSVSQGPNSQWNIVHRPAEGRVHFRTYASKSIKYVDLGAFDLDCTSPMLLLDIDTAPAGDATSRFEPYDQAVNRQLIENSMADIIEELPPGAINVLAGYPGALKCTLGEGGGGAGGAGTAAAGGGGATGGGTGGAAGGTPADDGGCGCRLAADRGDRERAPLWLVALVLGGGVRRVARPRSTGPRSKRCS